MAPSPQQSAAARVMVQLSEGTAADADAVFHALGDVYPCDRDPSDRPKDVPGGHPTIWSTEFDVSQERGSAAPASLDGSVRAQLQGGDQAVDCVTRKLGEMFRVEDRGATAGDQEKEVDLMLRSR
ncbi:hypothetical protein [Streptomyces sp. NPDC003077]|uniref:hypothetical protein n=1 Tax=Streptomyces sp. NPDC003077 TaxID=3154443 RepID=UPI0033BA6980